MISLLVYPFLFAAVLIELKHCLTIGPAATGAGIMEKPRILGGTEAKNGQYPWIISLHVRRPAQKVNESIMAHDCGGAIANEESVLTAAHCVWNKAAKDLMIIAGAHNIKIEESSQQRVRVSKIMVHPKYTAQDAAGPYDIAILKLKQNLNFNNHVRHAERASKNEPARGTCYNAGWGNQFPVSSMHYKGSDTLTTGKTSMISQSECRAAYPVYKRELETAICARAGMFHGTCQGDSGGPLTCIRSNGQPYLAGLVSFGFKVCNNGFHPDVYTDMAHPAIYNFVDSVLNSGKINEAFLEEKKPVNLDSASGRSAADTKPMESLDSVASTFGFLSSATS